MLDKFQHQANFDEQDPEPFTEKEMQRLADTYRELVGLLPYGNDSLRQRAEHHVLRLQTMRDNWVFSNALLSRRAYHLHTLLTTVVFSGLLRDVSDVAEAIDLGLELIVKEPHLKAHLKNILHQDHEVMKRSTIVRHRLTVHMAMCSYAQVINQQLLDSDGFVVWRTMDLSPLFGFEWVMHGRSCMKFVDMASAWHVSNIIRAERDSEDVDRQRTHQKQLGDLVRMEQGVPVALGKKSLKEKLHGMIHSEKLTVATWSGTAIAMNATMTFVGDLGEATICRARSNINSLFGDWVTRADGVEDGVEDDGDNEFGFEYQDTPSSGL